MNWHQIAIRGSNDVQAHKEAVGLIREFEGRYLEAGAPNLAEVYLLCKTECEKVVYFSPDASVLFQSELSLRGGLRCEPPSDIAALQKITL
jgi:hypothetical protein